MTYICTFVIYTPFVYFDRNKKIQFLEESYKEYGIQVHSFFPSENRYECPVRNPNYLTIGPSGEIYKCWMDVGNEAKIIGNINKNREVNTTLLTRYYVGADPFSDPECLSCFHLPTCGGGCPYDRIACLYNNKPFDKCDLIKGNIESFIEKHYEIRQYNTLKK